MKITNQNKSLLGTNSNVPNEFTERGIEQSRDGLAMLKVVTNENADVVEGIYATAARGASTLRIKGLEYIHANTNAAFDQAKELLTAKTPMEAIAMHAAFSRRQLMTMMEQGREFRQLQQETVAECAAPIRNHFENVTKRLVPSLVR